MLGLDLNPDHPSVIREDTDLVPLYPASQEIIGLDLQWDIVIIQAMIESDIRIEIVGVVETEIEEGIWIGPLTVLLLQGETEVRVWALEPESHIPLIPTHPSVAEKVHLMEEGGILAILVRQGVVEGWDPPETMIDTDRNTEGARDQDL